jgi:hypothetical protein
MALSDEENGPPDDTEAKHFSHALLRGQRALGRRQEVLATAIPCERGCGRDTRETMVYVGHGGFGRRVCLACAAAEFAELSP